MFEVYSLGFKLKAFGGKVRPPSLSFSQIVPNLEMSNQSNPDSCKPFNPYLGTKIETPSSFLKLNTIASAVVSCPWKKNTWNNSLQLLWTCFFFVNSEKFGAYIFGCSVALIDVFRNFLQLFVSVVVFRSWFQRFKKLSMDNDVGIPTNWRPVEACEFFFFCTCELSFLVIRWTWQSPYFFFCVTWDTYVKWV